MVKTLQRIRLGCALAASAAAAAAAPDGVPLTVHLPGQTTLEPGAALRVTVVFTNRTDASCAAQVEYVVQEDPALYSRPAPLPRYGFNVAAGARSWYEIGGKTHDIDNSLTDGKPWTAFGGPMNNNPKWEEAFATIDLGRVFRVVHMGRVGGEAGRMFRVDFSASLDGQNYTPVEGLQNVDFHLKWGPQEIAVPHPFQARFIRMRHHNNGVRVPVISLPGEFYVYDGEKPDSWAFPGTGARLLQGRSELAVPPGGAASLEAGDGRALPPGCYFVAVRTRTGDLTQMSHGRLLVMPPPMPRVTRDSRFGLNGIGYPDLALRQGCGWVRFENLKWPKVSAEPRVYSFDGTTVSDQNFDAIFRGYRERGLSILPFLFLTAKYQLPKDGKPNVLTYPPNDLSAYGEFVFQAVARYGSKKHPAAALLTADKISGLGYVDTFELWNEADLNDPNWGSWRGVFTNYYTMYRHGAEAVKRADPAARVANGGWSGMGVPLMESMRTFRYPDGKCPLDFTDVLSVHYYSFRVPPERATVNDNSHRSGAPLFNPTFEQELDALVAWRDRTKPGMPIWMTETGYDSGGPKGVDERLQAGWLPRDILMILAAGVDKVCVFRETGSGGNLFSASGVIRDDGTLKPSWFTYATLIRQMDGVTTRPRRLRFDDPNLRAYLWQAGERRILTAWAIEGTALLEVPLGTCTVSDAFGLARTADIAQALELTDFPLYVTGFTPATTRALDELAHATARAEQQRVARQAALQAYLYEFGTRDRGATLVVGTERRFTDVLAADRYDDGKGYGFTSDGQQDREAKWLHPPFSVKVSPGTRFMIKAEPGNYALQVSARVGAAGQVLVHGATAGDKALTIAPSRDGAVASGAVSVGPTPLTLETAFNGELLWITLIERERE